MRVGASFISFTMWTQLQCLCVLVCVHFVSFAAVRVSNQAAIHLYVDTLGYEKNDVEAKYYADGEDAYDMRKTFERLADEVEKQGGDGGDGSLVDKLKKMST